MKKLFSILLAGILCQISAVAQTIGYQGIARNSEGAPLANTTIAVRLSIKNAASGGNTFYTETKSATTNGFGLYTLSINDGSGNRTGDFGAINWSQATYIQTEIDPANGTAFTDMGTSLMQSVPSAIVADNLKGIVDPQEGETIVFKNGNWTKGTKTQLGSKIGAGINPSTTLNFLLPAIEVVINEPNPIISVLTNRAFGSLASGGGTGLSLSIGFQRIDISGQPVQVFAGTTVGGIRVNSGTRTTQSIVMKKNVDLESGKYLIGLVGLATSITSAQSWDDNGAGTCSVEVEY